MAANGPSPRTVVERRTLNPNRGPGISAAAAKPTYEIIRTTQVDEYDDPVSKAEALAAPVAMAATGNAFQGTARKSAKLSISTKKVEQFDDVKELIDTLPEHEDMVKHKPKITTTSTSKRVIEEDRNVRVTAWIYAASREDDNDFHLIVGRAPTKARTFITMEISGLPPANAASRAKLEKVRDTYMDFFTDLPGTGYDFYKPPIPVEIGGSLFFDMSHAKGGRPGPQDLRPDMPVVWEVHPVTQLVFEP